MNTKSFDAALDFLPDAKADRKRPSRKSYLRQLIEAFREARQAEADYNALIARGVRHEEAARRVFDGIARG